MLILYTTLVLLILLTAYFYIFPLSKRRPILIRDGGFVAYGIVVVIALYPLVEIQFFFIVIMVVVIFLSFFKLWFVYGVTKTMISDALVKATSATRSLVEKLDGDYEIDNNLRVRILNIIGKICIISFKKGGESKKAKLTVVVFKKFIQNYFV
ncbi:MAG: hypothetical protein UW07_C0005G0012 [Candidatus Nomurabacteria bacterium GW2011_GWF2_43_8]|uniref:Uncharacterized protein n=1 Tax=Candidatus Nomurabacteria bacterium GW2011_GWF2_43_8 TaxID=1618779 RepID=A0A0G1FR34_9BACT|nr:MAG: hypothetical protein UW07_C0005G0012 [Candidatus Nomurabacteria bacterium GW2011_GWF2_43_8]